MPVSLTTPNPLIKYFLFTIILCLFCPKLRAQHDPDFDSLILAWGPTEKYPYRDSIRTPGIYDGKDFSINLAPESSGFATKTKVLKNPYNRNLFSRKAYPLSYSLIYQGHIVALFEPGLFNCFNVVDLERNPELEDLLNTRNFKSHFLMDGRLYGITTKGKWFVFDNNRWRKTEEKLVPPKKRTFLYNDSDYLVYNECFGEWGGTVYFYHRESGQTFFTEATCANTVQKKTEGYLVLSELGHMGGTTDLQLIPDPSQLSNLDEFENVKRTIKAIGYSDSTNHAQQLFDFWGIMNFSMFEVEGQDYYLTYWGQRTFLTQMDEETYVIMDPLFNDEIFMHNPITTKYPTGEVLINFSHWSTSGEREVAVLLIQGKRITKIRWNKKRSY